jgi:Cof subfamily protein (haloacid dehalogenase superfamily)
MTNSSANNPTIQLVMADVDGTLVTPEKDLTERARQAVFKLRGAGLKFTLISSRPPYGLRSLAQVLKLEMPMIAFNGGMLVTPDGQALREYALPKALIPEILQCLDRYKLAPRLYTSDRWLIASPEQPYVEQETCTIEAPPTVVTDFQPYMSRIFKITGVSLDHDAVSRCRKEMQAMLGERACALCSQPYYLDITHTHANKGDAVVLMAETQHLAPEAIAVIGDMPSDVPMFRQAGLSIAMGNADDTVKQQADYTTDSNTADGFAKAMENCILGRKPAPVPAH